VDGHDLTLGIEGQDAWRNVNIDLESRDASGQAKQGEHSSDGYEEPFHGTLLRKRNEHTTPQDSMGITCSLPEPVDR
jgi:hypothetical protein